MTKRKAIDVEAVRKTHREYTEAHPATIITMEEWEAMPEAAQLAFSRKGLADQLAREADALAHVAKTYRRTSAEIRAIVDPAPVSKPWFLHPVDGRSIGNRANVMLAANPERTGALDWHGASKCAALMDACINQNDAEGSAWAAIETMQHVIRAELLEGPMQQIRESAMQRKKDSALGGQNKAKTNPKWWAEAIRHAKTLRATGHEPHEFAGICARRFGVSADAARKCLQHAGLVKKRKSSG